LNEIYTVPRHRHLPREREWQEIHRAKQDAAKTTQISMARKKPKCDHEYKNKSCDSAEPAAGTTYEERWGTGDKSKKPFYQMTAGG
jgi:hypothetical protein